jgi:hypothetical protein
MELTSESQQQIRWMAARAVRRILVLECETIFKMEAGADAEAWEDLAIRQQGAMALAALVLEELIEQE